MRSGRRSSLPKALVVIPYTWILTPFAMKRMVWRCGNYTTTRQEGPRRASRFCLSRSETNTAAKKNAFGPLRSHTTLAIWVAVWWFLAIQNKASGNEFQLGVLVKLCGSLHAVTSDRYRIAVLRCFHLTPADRRGLQWVGTQWYRGGRGHCFGLISGRTIESYYWSFLEPVPPMILPQ